MVWKSQMALDALEGSPLRQDGGSAGHEQLQNFGCLCTSAKKKKISEHLLFAKKTLRCLSKEVVVFFIHFLRVFFFNLIFLYFVSSLYTWLTVFERGFMKINT